jgi:two-component system sensor histidine kinase VicK
MNQSLKKILAPHHQYLILNHNLTILDLSLCAQRFADIPEEVSPGQDVRIAFPELIGVEDTLLEILEGRQTSLEIKGVARSSDPKYPLYVDLYIIDYFDEQASVHNLIIFLEDATKRMVLEQELAQQTNEVNLLLSSLATSKEYIDRIITSMADALLVTTGSGIIKTVNKSAQNIFKYSEAELLGKTISDLITDQKILQKISKLPNLEQGKILNDIEVICSTKTGETIELSFSCSVINTEIEEIQNFVYIGRDITERKRAEAEKMKAIEREKELRELKSRLISMTSNEFRLPINTIFATTELLENYGHTWPEDKKVQHYQLIESSVKRMIELLDNILTLGKADAGKLGFNPSPLVLKSFCNNLVEEIQLASSENQKINFVYSGNCNTVCLDEKLLQNILKNLLSNALKYSNQNTTVNFSCFYQEKAVIFEVQDQGIGIPREEQNQIFDSFYRAKNVGSTPGNGLGLTIVQKSVELQGGKISVNSEVGVGTTFTVTLPLHSDS